MKYFVYEIQFWVEHKTRPELDWLDNVTVEARNAEEALRAFAAFNGKFWEIFSIREMATITVDFGK